MRSAGALGALLVILFTLLPASQPRAALLSRITQIVAIPCHIGVHLIIGFRFTGARLREMQLAVFRFLVSTERFFVQG